MVESQMLILIDASLKQICQSEKPFTGKNVFVGDLFQLQPVNDSWIFDLPVSERTKRPQYVHLTSNLWKENVFLHELTEIMHQKDDKPFARLLNRIREGNHNLRMWKR